MQKFWYYLLLFILTRGECIAQNYIQIPDTAVYQRLKSEFTHRDADHSIDTLSCHSGWLQMYFSKIHGANLFGIQFLKCKTGYLICSGDGLTSLDYFPPRVERIDCSRNNIKTIDHLPKGLTALEADDNLLEQVSNLPEGLTYCSLKHNRLRTLPVLPKTMTWLNYFGNPIDTSLLGPEYKDNPCLYPNQNCLPKKKKFQNLYGLKVDSNFNVDDIREIEIKISGKHSWGYKPTGSTYNFEVKQDKLICNSVTETDMNKTPNVFIRDVKITSALTGVKKILAHIINGDKIVPISDIKPNDTSNQVVDFYNQFDGWQIRGVSCADCSDYEFRFTFFTSKSNISIAVKGSDVYVDDVMNTSDNSKVFPIQSVAEWMYAFAFSRLLLPNEKNADIFFSDKDFSKFKSRMSLK